MHRLLHQGWPSKRCARAPAAEPSEIQKNAHCVLILPHACRLPEKDGYNFPDLLAALHKSYSLQGEECLQHEFSYNPYFIVSG